MSQFRSISDVHEFLNAIPMFQNVGTSAANFSLDNIRSFCRLLDNPQDSYPTIHVAGTNGKGTTCTLLETIYAEAGYITGLFTSPHLLNYNERMRVGQKVITNESLMQFFQETEELLQEIKLSYFEISTALAFWYFAKERVDIAIIETGLGGRLDSTNIIRPEVSVITSIGLDHQNILGNTISEITREKAGIIKNGIPVIIGNVNEEARMVLLKEANKKNSRAQLAQHLTPEWRRGEVILKHPGEIHLNTPFIESVNKWNVACCWLVAKELQEQFPVDENGIIDSVGHFKGIPARFERMHPSFDWYFSGSHNAQALASSIAAVSEMKPLSEIILVFSAMKDKLDQELLTHFKGFKKAYFVEQEGERAAKFSDVKDGLEVELLTEDTKEIILKDLKTELVIFMGSFYFYPIVKRWTENVS